MSSTAHPPSANNDSRHVHFQDSYTPSALSLRLKLGPRDRPTMILKISVYFEPGRMPRVKVKTSKPRERRRRRRRDGWEAEEWRG